MTDLVEKVAEKIYDAARTPGQATWSEIQERVSTDGYLVAKAKYRENMARVAAAFSAIEAAGFVIVPVMPTPAMVEAGLEATVESLGRKNDTRPPAAVTWRAMIDTRPKIGEIK
jgi:hypothetical protein